MLHLRRWSLLLVDPNTRPGFSKLLDRIEGNGVRVGLIEDATRFARDLVAQELGILLLIQRHWAVACRQTFMVGFERARWTARTTNSSRASARGASVLCSERP